MEKVSKEKIEAVRKGYVIGGLSREENAAQAGVSTGTVSKIVADLEEAVGKDNLEVLRSLAVARRTSGLAPNDENSGAQLIKMARDKGISFDKLRELIEEMIWIMSSSDPTLARTDPEQLVKVAIEIRNMAMREGINDIGTVPALVENKCKEKKSLEVDIERLQRSRIEAKSQHEKALKETGLTLESLSVYRKVLKILSVEGVKDASKLAVILLRIRKEYGWDQKRIVEDLATQETLRQKIEKQRAMIASNEKKLKEQSEEDDYHRLVEKNVPHELKRMIVSRFNWMALLYATSREYLWNRYLSDTFLLYHEI